MNRVGLPSSKPKSPYLEKLDELLGKALEAFSKPRTRDAAHLAGTEEDSISQFIAVRPKIKVNRLHPPSHRCS